jgi:alpha-mannosidase
MAAITENLRGMPAETLTLPQKNGSIKDAKQIFTGHAHLDWWTWEQTETYGAAVATDRAAVDYLRKYPDAHHAKSSSEHFKYIKEEEPQLFQSMQELVETGQLEIVGGTVVEPDCQLLTGEQHARQFLYGQNFFYENFNRRIAQVAYNVDAFGMGDLAQILAKSLADPSPKSKDKKKIPVNVRMRPEEMEESNDPHDIQISRWVYIDGSEVIDYHLPYDYNASADKLPGHVQIPVFTWHPHPRVMMQLKGTGNHGGGVNDETERQFEILKADPSLPTLIHGRWDEFLTEIENEIPFLPEKRGPIEGHAPGVWATEMRQKLRNRIAAWLQPSAEMYSMMALQGSGREYARQVFHDAGWDIAITQFHDLIAGTAKRKLYTDFVYPLLEGAIGKLQGEEDKAFLSVAKEITLNPEEGVKPVIVGNSLSWDVAGVADFETYDVARHIKAGPLLAFHAVTSSGVEVPIQEVLSDAEVPWQKRYVAWVDTIPAAGHDVLYVKPGAGKIEFPSMEASDTSITNGRYDLKVDPETGYISQLFDTKNLIDVFRGEAGIPLVYVDESDTWGHGMHLDQLAGQFKASQVALVENGPVCSTIQIDSEFAKSTMTQYVTMYNNSDRIDISYVVNWQERNKTLKLQFPLNFIHTKAMFEGPYSLTKRRQSPQNVAPDEVSMLNWFDLTGESNINGLNTRQAYGTSFMTNGISSASIASHEGGRPIIEITALSSKRYAKHHPGKAPEDKKSSTRPEIYQNQGVLEFGISILPHERSWEDARTPQHAAEFNKPLKSLVHDTIQKNGNLPERDSYLQVESTTGSVIVPVMKLAEDGSGDLILRVFNTTREPTDAVIRLPHWQEGRDFLIEEIAPNEVMTFRIPNNANDPITEVIIPEMEACNQDPDSEITANEIVSSQIGHDAYPNDQSEIVASQIQQINLGH